ncbi:unnamed protein product [Cladocopium goreaui]|uniref:J domain-containing protein n=1 Tax=Cladocopium goreaui TaxID=2562237 RepID=A0A9P1FU30_9DINO|nr:unnamed protein product [Cladocopium goreaui]
MSLLHTALRRATHVDQHHFGPNMGLENPLSKCPGTMLEVHVAKATEILGMDNGRMHPFCVTAYYPGESEQVAESRKSCFKPAMKSALGSRREDVFFFETIRLPYDPRQDFVMVEIRQVNLPLHLGFEDDWVGRVLLPLADRKVVEEPAEWDLARGPYEYGGMVTVSVKFPEPEVRPLPDLQDFQRPVCPRPNSKESGEGGVDMTPFEEPRSSGSRSPEGKNGKTPPKPIWMPVINGPGGSGFGLTNEIEKMVTFQPKGVQDVKVGSMSPLPSFGPDWFTSKLPGTLAPRPLPACAFGLPPAPPGLIAQMPELATVSPGVAAMVAEALRAPPLTTPGMPPPPQSVLAMPVRCGRTSMVPRCGGRISSRFAPVTDASAAYGRNLCRVAC